MKLFEIPVYAISKETLAERVERKCQKIRNKYEGQSVSDDHMKQTLTLSTFPWRLWEYNHIIGYIVISKQGCDMVLDWYAPLPRVRRYHWDSETKHFFQNTQLSGHHFYTGNMNSGVQLRERLNVLVNSYVEEFKKRGYYADLEAFNNVDNLLDYDQLLKM